MAERIDRRRAAPWPAKANAGDTVWLGAINRNGLAVSFIQSIYFEFGSGCVLPETGVLWQNRAAAFSLDPDLVAALERAGHEVEMLPDDFSDTVGHAGLITRRPDGRVEGAHDPRGDGASEE